MQICAIGKRGALWDDFLCSTPSSGLCTLVFSQPATTHIDGLLALLNSIEEQLVWNLFSLSPLLLSMFLYPPASLFVVSVFFFFFNYSHYQCSFVFFVVVLHTP